jgi:PhoPQ-activated pathogenicity-related protein
MVSLVMAVLAAAQRPPLEFYRFLAKPDRSFQFHLVSQTGNRSELSMVSQTWHGGKWTHTILLQRPVKTKYQHIGILYITGDGPRKGDLIDLALVTQSTGMPVAMLFDIPNQPIDGHREDDLIAHTFEEYLRNPDPTLPLLFPMTKSAIRAMDAIQRFTRRSADPISEFVVVGASKRGWTTWMVGASGDRRVKAIVPMVYDNLNLPAQMSHQIENWGKYSDQIQDYTRRGLQAQLATPRGSDLGAIIDPYSYRRYIRVPTLVVKGSNDPYWSVDSLDLYWKDLRQPKWLLTVPNAGHTLGDGLMAFESIGAFAQSMAGEFKMPSISWKYGQDSGVARIAVTSTNPPFSTVTLWAAQSDTLDFRQSKYERAATLDADLTPDEKQSTNEVEYRLSPGKNVALFAELRYTVDGREFSLSTPTEVFRKTP